jgi:CYTH domain-containing protein
MSAGREIERKFLVRQAPEGLDAHPSDDIDQGYVAVTRDGVEVRVRSYGPRAALTIKSGRGMARLEEEFEIDQRRFRSLWPLTEGRRLQKTRYRIPAAGATIELDIYKGALEGLVIAEVEFDSVQSAAAFSPPDWFGREITDDPAYKNQCLATEGLPT